MPTWDAEHCGSRCHVGHRQAAVVCGTCTRDASACAAVSFAACTPDTQQLIIAPPEALAVTTRYVAGGMSRPHNTCQVQRRQSRYHSRSAAEWSSAHRHTSRAAAQRYQTAWRLRRCRRQCLHTSAACADADNSRGIRNNWKRSTDKRHEHLNEQACTTACIL